MNRPVTRRPGAGTTARVQVLVMAVVIASLVAIFGLPSLSSAATSFRDLVGGDRHSGLGAADGVLPDGASVFDDSTPAVTRLAPGLLGALRRAARDAARDGVEIRVNSGWRSARYQE